MLEGGASTLLASPVIPEASRLRAHWRSARGITGGLTAWRPATLPQIGGSDEAWYDTGNKTCFLASRYATGGSTLGVVDARTNAFLGSVPTGKGSHSFATGLYNNHVFVPLPANPADLECLNGRVGVYGLAK